MIGSSMAVSFESNRTNGVLFWFLFGKGRQRIQPRDMAVEDKE
jgi:hypothetical protein